MGKDHFRNIASEYIRVADYILIHGGDKEGVFLEDGDEILGRTILKNLERGDPWDRKIIDAGSRGVHSMAMLFLRLLSSLPESVVPSTSVDQVLNLRTFEKIILLEKVLQ
jgi:hypothetical protein